MSNIAEGFERTHLPEKLQFYNVARGSTAEVRSLLYVIEDNFPKNAAEAIELRDEVVSVGKLVSGLACAKLKVACAELIEVACPNGIGLTPRPTPLGSRGFGV